LIIKIFSKYSIDSASTRYRFYQYFKFFMAQDIHCSISPLFDNNDLNSLYKLNKRRPVRLIYLFIRRAVELIKISSKDVDLVIIYTELFPYFPPFFEFLLKVKKIPYLLDYDDAIFHQYDRNKSIIIRWLFGKKVAKIMKNAEVVIVGNQYLEDYAKKSQARDVVVIPTVVDLDDYPVCEFTTRQVFTIVWIGSQSTIKYIYDIVPALTEICKGRKIIVRLIGVNPVQIPNLPVEVFAWSKETEFDLLRECHVGIMPLHSTPWEQGKCGLKIIQYMACGLPVVASPVGINTEIINDEVNGYFSTTTEEWIENLIKLYDNPNLLPVMGANGRKNVEERYSLQGHYSQYVDILKSFNS
jgi:glycosyltransferase involved in cell wall biosynthesis